MSSLTAFEMWLAGGVISIILGLILVVWNQMIKRHDDHVVSVNKSFEEVDDNFKEQDKHIGLLQSKASDLRADVTGIQINIINHADRFEDMHESLIRLQTMLQDGLSGLHEKLDNFRERRT